MTRCEVCQQQDAVVHVTKIMGSEVETSHLCEQCASERGITAEISIATMPSGSLFPELEGAASASEREPLTCHGCGATLSDIEASKRVGCAQCWSVFEGPLRELLRRVQGSTRHVGKAYSGELDVTDTPEAVTKRQRYSLQQALNAAIATERFEEAAVLRDQLRALDA